MEKLEGQICHIIYSNESGFKIINISESGTGRIITAKGTLSMVGVGEYISCAGKYVEHKEFGRQFDVFSFEKYIPEGEEEILEYLSSGIIKGVGEKTAEKIVAMYGKDSLDIIYSFPEKLALVQGISKKKAMEITEEYRENREFFNAVEYLKKYNMSIEMVTQIYKKFGVDTVDVVKENPYVIIDSGTRINFLEVDKIALELGMALNNLSRIEAAIKYALTISLGNGHTFVDKERLTDFVKSLTRVENEYIEHAISSLKAKRYLAENDGRVALESMNIAETEIAKILKILKISKPKSISSAVKKISKIEKEENIELTEEQRSALLTVLENPVTIITGGPGTGKTTITKFLTKIYKEIGKEVEIAAPTGKAAKRIAEVTGHKSSTIHRLLEIGKYDETNLDAILLDTKPIYADLVIVDEASMIDTYMLTYILRGIKMGCRLVLIGDIHQLPSVGPGKVLEDMIDSGKIKLVSLKTIFRQASKSNIIINAHRVNEGKVLEIQKENHIQDLEIQYIQNLEMMKKVLMEKLEKEMGSHSLKDFFLSSQILTPTKQGELGTEALNILVQDKYNTYKGQKFKQYGKVEFREKDRIMQIKNNYDITWTMGEYTGVGVFNGEMGWIEEVDLKEKTILVIFDDGKEVYYAFNELDQIIHSYAITIHKSQGSEFDTVIMVLPQCMPRLLTRNLLYTGISRAKKKLIIIGSQIVVSKMIGTERQEKRNTNLKEQIISEIEKLNGSEKWKVEESES